MVIFIFLLLLLLMLPQKVLAALQVVELEPTESAVVTSFFPDKNQANPEKIKVGFTHTHTLSFLRFDTEFLPRDGEVVSATLAAYLTESWGEEVVTIKALVPLADWCLEKLTWNTKPPLGAVASSSAVARERGWVFWEITDTVDSWLKEKNFGIVLGSDGGNFERAFAGINSDEKPVIKVTFKSPVELSHPMATHSSESTGSSRVADHCLGGPSSVKNERNSSQKQHRQLFLPFEIGKINGPIYLAVGVLGSLSIFFFLASRGRRRQ